MLSNLNLHPLCTATWSIFGTKTSKLYKATFNFKTYYLPVGAQQRCKSLKKTQKSTKSKTLRSSQTVFKLSYKLKALSFNFLRSYSTHPTTIRVTNCLQGEVTSQEVFWHRRTPVWEKALLQLKGQSTSKRSARVGEGDHDAYLYVYIGGGKGLPNLDHIYILIVWYVFIFKYLSISPATRTGEITAIKPAATRKAN